MKASYLLTKLQNAVLAMRDTQKAFFKEKDHTKRQELLGTSKRQERAVDEITETITKLKAANQIDE